MKKKIRVQKNIQMIRQKISSEKFLYVHTYVAPWQSPITIINPFYVGGLKRKEEEEEWKREKFGMRNTRHVSLTKNFREIVLMIGRRGGGDWTRI